MTENDFMSDVNSQIPAWVDRSEFDIYDIKAIQQGGCASGAFMPAVTYHKALAVMAEHGDDVLDYIEDVYGEVPSPPTETSWAGMAVFYLSTAVEMWVSQFDTSEVQS